MGSMLLHCSIGRTPLGQTLYIIYRSWYPGFALFCIASNKMKSAALNAKQSVDFLTTMQSLKLTKRTGWVRRGIQSPESVADHSYRMGLMSMLVQGTSYDYNRCLKLSLVHDIAESLVGDITPHCGVSDEDKYLQEAAAVRQIKEILGGSTLTGEEIEELWHEYEGAATPEANLVKDFDKVEMILQALEYEQAQNVSLQEFFDSTEGKWRTDIGRAWAGEILKRREQR